MLLPTLSRQPLAPATGLKKARRDAGKSENNGQAEKTVSTGELRENIECPRIGHSPTGPALQKSPLPQLLERLLELLLRIHHDWSVPRNGFLDRLP